MSSRPVRPPPKIVQEDEPDEEEMDEEEMDEEGGEYDMFDAMGTVFTNEDGDTIATVLTGLRDATDKIALNMEMQNKILVKILSALSSSKPCCCKSDT